MTRESIGSPRAWAKALAEAKRMCTTEDPALWGKGVGPALMGVQGSIQFQG